jgi:RecA/RadA recombinase
MLLQKLKSRRNFAFIDAEHAFDRNYAEKLGVDIENLIISQPDNGEQALEIAEKIRSGAIDIVIDSVAALTPKVRSKVKWEILKWDFMHV